MKVAFILGSLNRGGTETLMLDVFNQAKANDLDAIGIYRKSGDLENEYSKSGIPVYKIPFSRNIFRYLNTLRTLINDNEVTVVHAQQVLDCFFAWIACFGTGVKIVLTFHKYDYHDDLISKMIQYFLIRLTDLNVYVSNNQMEYYIKKYNLKKQKQKVIYNGISFDKLGDDVLDKINQSVTSNLRKELNILPLDLLIGTVGNFVHGRDHKTICVFLKDLRDKKVDFKFVFVGGRAEGASHFYDDCVTYCEENDLTSNVVFLGKRSDVPLILSQLDAFIYASDHDTFGIAVVEAMASGIPVFVNDWKVMNEITENGKYATIYSTKDVGNLLNHFLSFIENKKSYVAKASEAKNFVRNKYSIESHIAQLKLVYKN